MDLIIGAGITGLSYAASTGNDYRIVERESEIGGYCRTIKRDGFTWDYSGHFFHFQDRANERFVMENIPPSEILSVRKRTQIHYKGRRIDYPFQKNIHQLRKDEFIACLYDLFFNDNREKSDSFKGMLYAKFGRSIAEAFLVPYNEKLYACDLDELEADAMGRFFPYADKLEIIANFRKGREDSYNASFKYPRGGAIEYVESVFRKLDPAKASTDETLLRLDPVRKIAETNKRRIGYDRLVSTIPFPELLRLAGVEFDPSLYSCNKVLVFNLGFDKKGTERKNHWLYFPEKRYCFYRVGFYDNIFDDDRLSMYVEIGFRQEEVIDTEVWLRRVLEDLSRAGLITDHRLISSHSVVMDPAYVHVTTRMEKDRAEKMERLARYGIYSIGRYGGWCYCSIEDNVKEAVALAARLTR